LGINHLKSLVESYSLATKQPPPHGRILVHNQVKSTPGAFQGSRGFRAWWAKPAAEFVMCACGWRPDLGEHHRLQRPSPLVQRGRRRRLGPAH
jgi:hypothetical protein